MNWNSGYFSNLLTSGTFSRYDEIKRNKIIFANASMLISMLHIFVFVIVEIYEGKILLAVVLSGIFIVYVILLIASRYFRIQRLNSYFVVTLIYSLFIFINLTVANGSAVLWLICFPMIALFVLGLRGGLFFALSLGFFLVFIVYSPGFRPTYYSNEFNIRAIGAYALSLCFSLLFNLVVSSSHERLNKAVSKLKTTLTQMNQFSGDVSHELKTPLSIIRGELDILLRGNCSKSTCENTMKSVLEEIDHLVNIIDSLLFLSKAENDNTLDLFPFSLDELLLEVYEEHLPIAQRKNIRTNITLLDIVSAKGLPHIFKLAIANIIQNSIKYTSTNGSITIALHDEGDGNTIIEISDSGIGIRQEYIPYIFDRFYRVDKSHSLETGGSGLGLSVVKKIVELHLGTVNLYSKFGVGTKVIITLPAINSISQN
jgi:signal transduction histidine kinase